MKPKRWQSMLAIRDITVLRLLTLTMRYSKDALVFKKVFPSAGTEVVAFEEVPQGETDVPHFQISKLMAARPDAVYLLGYALELGAIIKQVREQDGKIPILSFQVMEEAQGAGDEQAMRLKGWCLRHQRSTALLRQELRKLLLRPISLVSERTLGSSRQMRTMQFASWHKSFQRKAQMPRRFAMDCARVRGFDGASGRFDIDDKGDSDQEPRLMRISRGKIELVQSELPMAGMPRGDNAGNEQFSGELGASGSCSLDVSGQFLYLRLITLSLAAAFAGGAYASAILGPGPAVPRLVVGIAGGVAAGCIGGLFDRWAGVPNWPLALLASFGFLKIFQSVVEIAGQGGVRALTVIFPATPSLPDFLLQPAWLPTAIIGLGLSILLLCAVYRIGGLRLSAIAVGDDDYLAALFGVSAIRTSFFIQVLGGAIGGFTGVLMAADAGTRRTWDSTHASRRLGCSSRAVAAGHSSFR